LALTVRAVKSPKIYIRDSGILHHLAGILNFQDLQGNVLIGNSWEGYVVERIKQRDETEMFETQEAFLKVREKALNLAQSWHVINTGQSIEQTYNAIEKILDKPKAVESFENLLKRFPDNDLYPETLYNLYKVNKEENNPRAMRPPSLIDVPA
jgi:hypothetical protein